MATSKKSVVENMKKLGVYRPEFDLTIDIYVGLIKQYNSLQKAFNSALKNGEKIEEIVTEMTADGGCKKSPIVATLENLRKDILTYSVQLGLTPAGLKRINDKGMKGKGKTSKLEKVLMDLGKG